ncbi:MAG: Adenylate kinase [Candidatus Bathyarchaeota archaeon B23]|nr:MAG: Adenylate kinase [Candidatus Bathyarchaeota archaeon B23]
MGLRLLIFGPPGSGKGTRARLISRLLKIPVITTGDMLRGEVSRETEVGLRAKAYMERGELVPDELVIELVEERLRREDCSEGFILDGFPRTLRQADALDRILGERGVTLDLVLNIVVDPEVVVERLSLRRWCPRCGAIYNLKYDPPRVDEICDECGAQLIQRSDDREEVVRRRLRVYEEQTRPILERYMERSLVREMRGDIPIEEIPREVEEVLGPYLGNHLD